MATISVTTTAAQDAALAAVIAKENAERAAQIPPATPWTTATYVQRIVRGLLDSYVEHLRAETHTSLKDAYEAASAGTKAQIKTLLGL